MKPPPPAGDGDETWLWQLIDDDGYPAYWMPSTDDTHWVEYEGHHEGQDLGGGWRNWGGPGSAAGGGRYYAHESGRSHWALDIPTLALSDAMAIAGPPAIAAPCGGASPPGPAIAGGPAADGTVAAMARLRR